MLSAQAETFIRLIRRETPDGAGGQRVAWTDGESVRLVCAPEEAGLALKDGVPEPGRRVLLFGAARLRPGERLRREADGSVLRVTGDSAHFRAPAHALHAIGQAEAEVIPDD